MKWLHSVGMTNRWVGVWLGAIFAVCLSAYPIVFFGKSYISPGYGTQLLYDGLPFVPGYVHSDLEELSADVGAMPWQNLPYSRVQHEAVFEHQEFPFWNRYNSGGQPLFGQGQSQILDPLHWIVVAGEGNGWAWDLKFLLSKLLFLAGIGSAVMLMTRSIGASVVIMMSSALIGLFYFRFNHPVFFNLTYAPWVFVFFLQWMKTIKLSARDDRWAKAWPLLGVMVSSVLLLFAGTPKEGIILFGFLHLAGMIGLLSVEGTLQQRTSRLGLLLPLWIVIGLVSAPHWLIFIDTLGKMHTVYEASPQCNFTRDLRFFVDKLFLGQKKLPWAEPGINLFLFVACLQALFSFRQICRQPFFWATLVPLVIAISIAGGIVPNSICQQIPFIGIIHHIHHTFLTSAVVFAALFAGLGFSEFLNDLRRGVGARKWSIFVVLVSALLIWWFIPPYDRWWALATGAGILAMLAVGGMIMFMLVSLYLIRTNRPLSGWPLGILALFFIGIHFHHGLHFPTGTEADNLLINPTPRADFLQPSPAISLLHRSDIGSSTDFVPIKILELINRSAVVAETLRLARLSGGAVEDIRRYEDDLRYAIQNSEDSAIATTHIQNFLRGVGATPDANHRFQVVDSRVESVNLDLEREKIRREPFRIIGEGRTPMSGFYSFLKLESLNGPDALRLWRYMEFLDVTGWPRKPGEAWLRTVKSEDIERLEPLLDFLNVGYFLSRSKDLNAFHLISNVVQFGSVEEGSQQNSSVAEVKLTRYLGETMDRVGCSANGLGPDGRRDNVFTVEIQIPKTHSEVSTIQAMRLERDFPIGVNHTGGSDNILGVSYGKSSPLLNNTSGQVEIPVSSGIMRLWLFACADGYDDARSSYVARIAVDRNPPLTLVYQDDMKIWKRNTPWSRAFFVDSIARFDEVEDLAEFVQQAKGIPFAAIQGDSNIPPNKGRTIIPATDYRLTSNTTAFHVTTSGSGMVVLTETNVPGDTYAKANGLEVPVITVNHAFRGIEITTAGEYEIVFSYRPRLWSTSLWMLVGGIAVMIMLLGLSGRVIYRRQGGMV